MEIGISAVLTPLNMSKKNVSICRNTHTSVCVRLHNAFILHNHHRKAQNVFLIDRMCSNTLTTKCLLKFGEKGTTYQAFIVKSYENLFCQLMWPFPLTLFLILHRRSCHNPVRDFSLELQLTGCRCALACRQLKIHLKIIHGGENR